jgi:Ca2+-transporting ATPase
MTWAAVELGMLQRLLDTTSLSGGQWVVVLALSLVAPAVVAVDKLLQIRQQRNAQPLQDEPARPAEPAPAIPRQRRT